MADGIQIEGMEEFEEMLQEMTLEDSKMKKAMKTAIEPVATRLEADTPKGESKKLSKIKTTVKKDGMGVVGVVKTGAFYDIFNEFGTSYSKSNVGYFDRSINSSKDSVLQVLKQELLK